MCSHWNCLALAVHIQDTFWCRNNKSPILSPVILFGPKFFTSELIVFLRQGILGLFGNTVLEGAGHLHNLITIRSNGLMSLPPLFSLNGGAFLSFYPCKQIIYQWTNLKT